MAARGWIKQVQSTQIGSSLRAFQWAKMNSVHCP